MRRALLLAAAAVGLALPVTAYANDKQATKTTLHAPKTIKQNRTLKLTGSVSGGAGGAVKLMISGRHGKLNGTLQLSPTGKFKFSTTNATLDPGRLRVQVRYLGDSTHMSSRASATVQVTAR